MRDMKKPNFNLEDYYEIHIEERFTGSEIRDYCPVATSVKKEYFQKLVETLKFLKGNFFLILYKFLYKKRREIK